MDLKIKEKVIAEDVKKAMIFCENINWTRLWWIVGIILGFWTGMVTLIPPAFFKPVAVILAAIQSAFLFAACGSKYVKDNVLPPEAGGGQQ